MTDEELKQLVAGLAIAQKETGEQLKCVGERLDKVGERLDKVGVLVGNIGQNQGDVAENFFYNSLIEDTHLGKIHFDDITKNMEKHRGNIQEEYDIVMTNSDAIGIVEVKYKAHQNDLQKLERKMRNFKKLFPVYKSYKLYGAIASFHINKDAKKEALQRGFFVLERSGKVLHTESGEHLLVL
jgi:Holliday junction resolvase-like predicted endonuclease